MSRRGMVDIINVPITQENIEIICSALNINKEALWLSEEDNYINVYAIDGEIDAVALMKGEDVQLNSECTPETIQQALLDFTLNN